jgi:bifunctional NMN adenylyltransferase/nudix hydrolase
MSKKFNAVVFIGRFQPVHNAHMEMIRRAGEIAEKVIIIRGSAGQPRTFKNPWIDREGVLMLQSVVDQVAKTTPAQYIIETVRDSLYNDIAWAAAIQSAVSKNTTDFDTVGIIGHSKDVSSYYLKMFPQWKLVEQPLLELLDASQIREVYFTPSTCNMNWFKGVLPESTITYLSWFKDSPEYNQVVREKEFLSKYKKQFENLPYAPTFVTADAVVVQSGHVLLVKRGSEPGRGLWAFPGGFVNAKTDPSVFDAAIRELKEETKIDVPEKVLRGNVKTSRVFDAIGRSARGRTITHAFYITLQDGEWNLPKIKGGDDASDAKWIPLSQVKSEEMFEDHYEILKSFVGA